MKPFYNTIGISGLQLEIAQISAKSLEESILKVFKHYNKKLTPYQVHDILRANGKSALITSVRRAMTNLSNADNPVLFKSPYADAPGPHNVPNHTWSLTPYEEREAA